MKLYEYLDFQQYNFNVSVYDRNGKPLWEGDSSNIPYPIINRAVQLTIEPKIIIVLK